MRSEGGAPEPFSMRAVNRGAGSGSSASASANCMHHAVFDSDADTDPDTDAWGSGRPPGSSSFLTVSAQHVVAGLLLGIGVDSDEALRPVSSIPEGFQRIANMGSRSAPRLQVGKGNKPGGAEASAAFPHLHEVRIPKKRPFLGCVLCACGRAGLRRCVGDRPDLEAWALWVGQRVGDGWKLP
jgi:hypothetical protein